MTIKKYADKYKSGLYVLFRLLVGLMFFMHGSMKLFGWFGGSAQQLMSLMGVAGVVETLAGLGIFFGFFGRLSALGGLITMIVAFFMVHFPNGWNPLANGGELALVYFASFLIVLVMGNGAWSLEKVLLNKEVF
ncbi:DoxX family protein [Candidatus Woesearchaeota archaeon CG10_big_fil_rev_8_21_14_0_10_45_16]|nr:MAG: DoxX family protein [Candidatus Woesearchaeota archaeon CG10_big_fil_rev_8_21_14_0_10_45_16]